MTGDAQTFIADARRYGALIEERLAPGAAAASSAIASLPPFEPRMESATAVQVERGRVLVSAVLAAGMRQASSPSASLPNASSPGANAGAADPGTSDQAEVGRLIEIAPMQHLGQIPVVDADGTYRPLYRPLLIYAWLIAFQLRYETLPRSEFGRWDEALRPWCDLLEQELAERSGIEGPTPAAAGATAAETAWSALALHVAGKVFVRDAWTDLAADAMGRLVRGQQPSGAFILTTAADNPEQTWFHELAILHAAGSYAVQAEERGIARAVARSSEFHLREIQPDHATSRPWALFPFIWNANARPLADQLLHTVALQHAGSADGLSLILLADALYCVRLFL